MAASAIVEAVAASSAQFVFKIFRVLFQELFWPLLARLQKCSILPFDWRFQFVISNGKTGQELLSLVSSETIAVISPNGKVYEMPKAMVEELKQAKFPRDVVRAIETYQQNDCITYDVWNDADFHALCVQVTEKDIKLDSVCRTLENHHFQRVMQK